ncbi:alpha/beta fold hydrolase [Siccationidurans ginsengisoli]|uniref:alpha/beta fold hydrolase n=1 Tax=Hymenobacter TaxID=89966 RepID=UPI001AAC6294|nr:MULTISPECIES: alpha/beta fold hydrolase [unclassified Hymenobacter]MBO2033701.1 alpha/beta fold hydrolase [Hymenobacter sp. BT559]
MRLAFLRLSFFGCWLGPLLSLAQSPAAPYPTPAAGDFALANFRFASGETLPTLTQHYTTVGQPRRDKAGRITNAVLIMHGTTGAGTSFLSDLFAGHLFGPGQPLDAAKYYVILPDAIGHGKSSKPSDGLRMKFPKYTYDDMVAANYRLLTEKLGVTHLRLVMGTSMGGMETWVWGYQHPGYMDALLPLASLPVEIGGRNRMLRKMAIDLIEMDPAWQGGNYTTEPKVGLAGAASSLIFMTSSPKQMQKLAPTRAQAEAALAQTEARLYKSLDANDFIYQFDASRDYNPAPHLAAIQAPLFAINSADDQVNPPELGILETEIKKVPRGRYILLPITDLTTGHGTHSNPAIWGQYLLELLALTGKPVR